MKKLLVGLTLIALILPVIVASIGHATTVFYNTTADNEFYLYLGTNPAVTRTQIGYGNSWMTTYSGNAALTPGITQYLQVWGINSSGPASFIGDFTLSNNDFHFANGTQHLVTNTTDWFVSLTGLNVLPNVATGYGNNGVAPWGSHPSIDANAQWIWTTDYYGPSAYLSTPISPSAVPEPSTLLLLGSGLIGLSGLRKKFRK